MKGHQKAINALRLRVALFLFLRLMLIFMTVWGFLWGTAVLVLRGAVGVPLDLLLWGLAGLPIAMGLAVGLASRRVPSRTAARSLLDERGRCGGLLMAEEETDIGEWERQIPAITAPSLRWRNRRCPGLFAAAVIFVLVSFLVPQRLVELSSTHALEIGREAEKLTAQIETLKEEEIIESPKAESLQEKLDQIRKEASGEDPVKTWEALDHLEDVVSKAAEQAAEEALAQTERLTQAETLTEGLADASAEGAAEMDGGLMTEAMKELAGMIHKAAQESELLKRRLSQDQLNACKSSSLSPEQLEDILRALRLCKGDIARCLGKLCRAGLLDLETLKLCESLGRCDSAGLLAFLAENTGKFALCDLLEDWCQGMPGRGGIDRGRGDAPMTWSDATTQEGATFKEEVLPPASVAALKESMLAGVSVGAPSVEKGTQGSTSDALANAAAGGGAAATHTILPRHRGTVKRYFQRQ